MSDRFSEINDKLVDIIKDLFIKYGTNIDLDKIEPELVQEIDNKFDDIYSKLPLNRFVRKIVIPSKVGDTYKSITILGIGEPKRGEIDPVDLVESYEHDIEYPVGKVPKVVLTNVVPMNILK